MTEAQTKPSLLTQMGGVAGMVYAGLPSVVFVIANAAADLRAAVMLGVGAGAGIAGLRLLRREPLQPALSGLLGVAVGAVIAYRTGDAKDFFVVGIALLPLSWFGMMRLVRGQVLALREAEYVEAARAMGTSTPRILFRHILPNVVSPVIVAVSFGIGSIALSEVILSFFGLGVQPPRPSLGVMIGEVTARGNTSVSVLRDHPEQLLAPIAVVWLMIFCWNIIGDALNDVLNPRAR